MFHKMILSCLLLGLLTVVTANAQDNKQKMPRENVVEVPAIGKGLCVSNAFQTNMVLQRGKPVAVWGWATPGEKITLSFAGQTVEATAAADRSWKVTLKAMPANSTPQTMTIKGKKETLTLENILVGDVWILGGQSNMEFGLSKVDDGMLEVASANFPQIRMLTVPRGNGFDSVNSFARLHEWSSWSSRHFRKGDWDVCSPEIAKEFSAIGYVFGRRLFMATRVPIGLIDASIGGTTVEAWTPDEVLRKIKGQETQDKLREWEEKIAAYDAKADLERRIAKFQQKKQQKAAEGNPFPASMKPPSDLLPGPAGDKNRPGYCYASTIKPLEGLTVKGAAFHQGFNNCFGGSAGARMYYQIFGKMIASWRKAFNDSQMPFCIISLCTAGAPQTRENYLKPMNDVGVLLREAQYQTFRDLYDAGDKGIGFVSCFDFRKSWYHPQIKVPVGERAAKWALASQYEILNDRGSQESWLPPSIKESKTDGGTIRLKMSTSVGTKDESDGKMLGFAIAGQDRRFYPAEIQYYTDGKLDNRNRPVYQRDVLVLSSPFVDEPLHYRYAWARNPMANVVSSSSKIPIASQRSDDWIREETPIKFPLQPGVDMKSQSRRLNGLISKELELGDIERQIKEAEATIARLKDKYIKDAEAWEKKKASEIEKARQAKEKATK